LEPEFKRAKLVLEDNSVFEGFSFGAENSVSGEVVFNTGMVGYPESFSDPSYRGQILCLTYPLIGNYGVSDPVVKEQGLEKFFESSRVHIQGLVVSEYSQNFSHWNAKMSLQKWLQLEGVPAIMGVDTRALTKKLREKGVMLGKIVIEGKEIAIEDPNARNLVAEVSIKEPVSYGSGAKKVALLDCGVKNNIIRALLQRKVSVLRVPWDYPLMEKNEKFDAVLVSNGPGDPKLVSSTIETTRKAMDAGIPVFGICLGNQILALAAGGNTFKLKYGHRSQNQPCKLKGTKNCYITSQNHGFAVDIKTLSEDWVEWFVNANDATNEGIKHKTKPFMSVQFHPEATPGPVDTGFLFDEFLKVVK